MSELVMKYLGRKFGQGVSGCFLFVKEFYRVEFGVEIINDYIEMLNEFKVVKETPRFGDVVLIKNHPIVTNHVGVYIGNNEFLHGGALKDRDEVILNNTTHVPYCKRIVGYLRHPELQKRYDTC